MDIEEIKTLTDLMVENDLSEIMIRDGERRIVLRRRMEPPPGNPLSYVTTSTAPVAPPTAPAQPAPAQAVEPESAYAFVRSPMVGTYYSAPDPESPAFVKVGDRVHPDSVVCIIEAMKVFNEIKAEMSGTVESIEVSNGLPVEFGQPIIKVRPG